jgi:hypothetical protein
VDDLDGKIIAGHRGDEGVGISVAGVGARIGPSAGLSSPHVHCRQINSTMRMESHRLFAVG